MGRERGEITTKQALWRTSVQMALHSLIPFLCSDSYANLIATV